MQKNYQIAFAGIKVHANLLSYLRSRSSHRTNI